MMKAVLRPHTDDVHRQWFTDARDDGRRMEVSWHSDERLVIVSLWHGSLCRATFRMSVEQAPDLIETLARALGDAAHAVTSSGPIGRRSSRRAREPLWAHDAEIIRLPEHPTQ
jgi:hypothetical protein